MQERQFNSRNQLKQRAIKLSQSVTGSDGFSLKITASQNTVDWRNRFAD